MITIEDGDNCRTIRIETAKLERLRELVQENRAATAVAMMHGNGEFPDTSPEVLLEIFLVAERLKEDPVHAYDWRDPSIHLWKRKPKPIP